ncbi:hypothetical protein [Bradyrhizobium sp. LTSPM299]|uniref:hypothetical protein n=1 Tax=Bradyrhizobium sp. LTSPM299 TaxID=1619233 RepID=UPI0012E19701|nr:hypothetical protein [Bradyrhizobium sp. LTSPM299]
MAKWTMKNAQHLVEVTRDSDVDRPPLAGGRELGARYVLEGSVRKARERVRVSAQLVEAETGTHLWVERYDRELEDIFKL